MAKATKSKVTAKKAAPKAAVKTTTKAKASASSKNSKTVAVKAKAPVQKKTAAKKPEVKKTTVAKPVAKQAAPAKAAVKATVKGKTAVKVTQQAAKAPEAKAPVAAKPEVKAEIKKAAPVSKLPLGKPPVVAKPAPMAPQPENKKPEKLDFAAGDFVVYPAHGVGYVEGVETQMIAGMEITLYTISFEKDRMRLKLPVSKVKASGLRKLSSKDRLKDALSTLQGRSQVRRVMWSRRAQEYEAKINSGDPVAIAEVLRDLKKADDQAEQSYSERQIYQAALERLAREVAAIEKIDEKKAAEKLEAVLGNVA